MDKEVRIINIFEKKKKKKKEEDNYLRTVFFSVLSPIKSSATSLTNRSIFLSVSYNFDLSKSQNLLHTLFGKSF